MSHIWALLKAVLKMFVEKASKVFEASENWPQKDTFLDLPTFIPVSTKIKSQLFFLDIKKAQKA